jgi:hypothetical protein
MSTGITCPIEERVLGLREYLERCWALCNRDHDISAPLPVEILEEPHYAKRVSKYETELIRANSMTLEEAAKELAGIDSQSKTFWQDYNQRKAKLRLRYDSLIAEIESWNAPPDAASYKNMAMRHAVESRDWDCGNGNVSLADEPPITADAWLADKRATAARLLDSAKTTLANHQKYVRQANAVLSAIRAVAQ